MKKLLLILLCLPIIGFGQIKEINSDKELLVFDDKEMYNSTKVYYDSKNYKDKLIFFNDNQRVFINISRVIEFGELYEKGMNKSIEWYEVAKKNDVKELEKDMDWTFKTDGGILYNGVSFYYSAPFEGFFKVRITLDGYSTGPNYRFRVMQKDENEIHSEFVDIGLNIVSRDGDLKKAKMLINFCKNYEKYVNEAIDKFNRKDNLFK